MEDGAYRLGISLGHDEHPENMPVCTSADKHGGRCSVWEGEAAERPHNVGFMVSRNGLGQR
jgi:hypothetical protein